MYHNSILNQTYLNASQNTSSHRDDSVSNFAQTFDNSRHLQLPTVSTHFNNIKNNFNPGYQSYRHHIRSALNSNKNSARGLNSMHDPREMAQDVSGMNVDSEINDDEVTTTHNEIEAVKPRAVVAS